MIITSDAVNTSDDRAVAEVLHEVYAAWASGDADAFVTPYTEHATAVLPGSYLQGKDTIRSTMAAGFAGPLHGSRGVHQVQSIRFPGADTAIVISKGGIVYAGQTGTAAETRSVETWVLSRQDGTWRIEAFHNSPENTA